MEIKPFTPVTIPVRGVHDAPVKARSLIKSPFYLVNNKWNFAKSEARRLELQKERVLKDAQSKIKINNETISPIIYERAVDLLSDIID